MNCERRLKIGKDAILLLNGGNAFGCLDSIGKLGDSTHRKSNLPLLGEQSDVADFASSTTDDCVTCRLLENRKAQNARLGPEWATLIPFEGSSLRASGFSTPEVKAFF